jgi:hypothetical protein
MVTQFKIEREYLLQGVVVNRATQIGVRGVLVEAWDLDTKYNDMLGQVTTDANGEFTVGFDSDYFGNAKPDNGPDVFYKVFMDGKQVLSTVNNPVHNLQKGTTRVKLELDLPQLQAPGTDRVRTEQAFKAIDWWHASDFRGTFNQGKSQASTVGGVVGLMLGSAFTDFNFQPVQPKGVRENEVINQSPDNARSALMQQQVDVTEVKSVSALSAPGNTGAIAGYPVNLKAGDRVTLYQDNGVVKYYTRDPAPSSSADGATIARIDGDLQTVKTRVAGIDEIRAEVADVKTANAEAAARTAQEAALVQTHADELSRLQGELEKVQQANASKDLQIAKLQSDLSLVTKAQDSLIARLPLSRIDALEQQLNRLSVPAVGTPLVAPAVKKAAKPAARRKPSQRK